ncbi:hypothetical protein WSM22_27310 [Cytophagales bacterium WSM2-2]|nr:hypothetical protein WSM22_27310 [Cytophagales bacterium WSM2-2]
MRKISFETATAKHVSAIVELRNSVANNLVEKYGSGHWSHQTTEKGVAMGITNTSKVLLAFLDDNLVGTLRLAQKKPWAIDVSYFSNCKRPLYLVDMAIAPPLQKSGIGKMMIQESKNMAKSWPADAIRLDAYDAPAGAGDFYHKCGFESRGRVIYRKVALLYYEMLIKEVK